MRARAAGLSRRTFLQLSGATGAGVVMSAAADAPLSAAAGGSSSSKRVYVVVVDGCRPDEITATLTPRMHTLRRGGMSFPNARSLPVDGGSPLVRRRFVSSVSTRTLDVAPTVGRVFGLDSPRGGYDGHGRL